MELIKTEYDVLLMMIEMAPPFQSHFGTYRVCLFFSREPTGSLYKMLLKLFNKNQLPQIGKAC